jgi:predicted CXXCH cytochrome family protein
MVQKIFARWDLIMQSRFIALIVVLTFGYPGLLTAKERSSSTPLLPVSMQTGTDLTNKCLECHNYRENHHPIDIAPSNPASYPLPLYEDKIMCLTCHTEDHSRGSEKLLRGGPYSDLRQFCYKCHALGMYTKIDPHVMLDGRGNVQNLNGRSVCLFCHSVMPDPAKDRTGDVRFRADVAFLCWRCHPSMAAPTFFNSHFLVKPSDTMRKFIEAQEQKLNITIPLVPRDRITCSTCHNPHQKGVILYAPSASGADAEHRLRMPATKICFACHDFH